MNKSIISALILACLILSISVSVAIMFLVFGYRSNHEIVVNCYCSKIYEEKDFVEENVIFDEEEHLLEEEKEKQLQSLGWFTITAYCPCEKCCGEWADGITATGTTATQGRTVAVDPSVIELGSVVYFEGVDGLVGGYIAEDTGGAIKGNRIDLFFDDHQEALEWGIKELEVFEIVEGC